MVKKVHRDGYIITWDAKNKKIRISPTVVGKKMTPRFGVGNAVIKFNLDKPPKKMLKKVTGDSDADGFIPSNPYNIPGDWVVGAGTVTMNEIKLSKTDFTKNGNPNDTYRFMVPVISAGYYGSRPKDVTFKRSHYKYHVSGVKVFR